MRYFVTTPKGLEAILAEEGVRLGATPVRKAPGRVHFDADRLFIYLSNSFLRTANRVFIELVSETHEGLGDIGRVAASIDYTPYIGPGTSFAVRAERVGSHDFTSVDVGRVVGAAVIESLVRSRGYRPSVNLRSPDVEIYVYVIEEEFIIGVNTSGESLHKRRYRVVTHPAALKTTLAAAMYYLAGEPGRLIDPMCGGGTIPAEAVQIGLGIPISRYRRDYMYKNLPLYSPDEEVEALSSYRPRKRDVISWCTDISHKSVYIAIRNLLSAGIEQRVILGIWDAENPFLYELSGADAVITNPPYGIRSHNPRKIPAFYRSFIKAARDGGISTIVCITPRVRDMIGAVRDSEGVVEGIIHVMHGGLRAGILKIRF